ncbi:MAG: membrane protein of unknown function [Promethearchaeota archaeon]|nr:MAG: membrane protein of unknown function [Candidatus Lokiarchaeota archaeon]
MKMKKSKKISILSIIGFCIFFCVFSTLVLFPSVIDRDSEIELNAAKEIGLNQEYKETLSSSHSALEYYLVVTAGDIDIKVTLPASVGLNYNLTIARNVSYTDIIYNVSNQVGDVNKKLSFENPTTIYIIIEHNSGIGDVAVLVSNGFLFLMEYVKIGLIILLAALTVGVTFLSIKRAKSKTREIKFEIETDKQRSKIYSKILKYCTHINNLSILNYEENKMIETELKQTGVGYYTTTHSTYSSSSSGYRGSYSTTRPYTYTIRYNSIINFLEGDGKTLIKMELNPGKMFRNAFISPMIFLSMGIMMGVIFFVFDLFEDIWTLIPIFMILGIALVLGGLMPFLNLRTYKKAGEDQFNLLVRKPLIQYDIDSKELAQEIELTTKKGAQPTATERVCTYCGKIVAKDAKVCESCGSELS